MRMDKPKKCRNQNSLTNTFAILVTITLLIFGALTMDPLLVLATGEVEDEENRNVDGSVNNGNDPLSSSPLPSPPSQQGINTDIIGSSTSGAAVLLSGSNGFRLDSTILENNQIAMFMTGADNAEVQQNMIKDNNIGIASHSNSGSKISSNLMSGNQLAGITFVNTKSSSMDMNNIHGSQDGVFLDEQSSDNTINANNVLQNAVDINNANGLPLNINFNQYTENNCGISNPSGLCIGG